MPANVEDILNNLVTRLGKVRRWLLALGVLRTAALWLVCISLYVGLYTLADDRFHFGRAGRLAALTGLVGLLIVLSHYLIRTLRREMSYSRAASHVETAHSFGQQLIAAVEYYEKGPDYPYSKRLAQQLVLRVDESCRDFAFDSTVDKRQGYLLAGCIMLCLAIVTLFVAHNVHYFLSYAARLVSPLAAIEPVPAMTLKTLTGDVVTGPNVAVTLAAKADGRIPESASFVLASTEPNDTTTSPRQVEVSPIADANGIPMLTATTSFEKTGEYAYHFEVGGVSSETHTITVAPLPAIEEIAADVTVRNPDSGQTLETYTEKIGDQTISVLPGSRVALHVKANIPLKEATIGGAQEQPVVQRLDGAQDLNLEFTADKATSISFQLVSAKGLANPEPLTMRVVLKTDTAPRFKLLSPDGDCLATDVASIPVSFEITDDFGLERADLCCEMPSGNTVVLDTNAPGGAKRIRVSHTIELEQYELKIGDALLFYANARDIDTGFRRADPNTSSEIYFIEIRPYHQYWHPQPSGGPSSTPGPVPEDLITILEYLRAILKKTWSLAENPPAVADTKREFEKLYGDVKYCASKLAEARDDSENNFSAGQKITLSHIVGSCDEAAARLDKGNAPKAMEPVRRAYRALRKFIDELNLKWNPPDSGQSVPQDTPERVRIQEQPKTPDQEEQRIERRLEKAQSKIETLTREEKALKTDLTKALQKQNQQSEGQSTQGQGQQSSGEQSPSQPGSAPGSEPQSQDAQSASNPQSGSGDSSAQTDALLRMLEARQKALREQASQLSADLAQMAAAESSSQSATAGTAQERLGEATTAMKEFEDKLTEARYSAAADTSRESGMADMAESAARKLAEAGRAIEQGLSRGQQPSEAQRAETLARQLAKDADALDESLDPKERQQMLDRLKAAERLLESMAVSQWQTVSRGGGPGAAHAYTQSAPISPSETARMLSRQFWSAAIQARDRQMQGSPDEPSDARFFELENDFFENAARFGSSQDKK
jgi:hypothetical protein